MDTNANAPKRARGLSLQAKWTGALLAVAVLPLVAYGVVALRVQRTGLIVAEQQLEIAVGESACDRVSNVLDSAQEATVRVGRLITDPSIADDAKLRLVQETVARTGVLANVAVYGTDFAHIDTIARVDAGRSMAHAPDVPAEVRGADPSRGLWTTPTFGEEAAVMRYAIPIDRDGARLAWVIGTLDPSVVNDTVASLARTIFHHDDAVLLLDRTLHVLASGGEDDLAVGRSVAGRDIGTRVVGLQDAVRGNYPQRVAVHGEFTSTGNVRMVGTLVREPGRGWFVAVRRPEREAYGALVTARNLAIASAAALALAAIVVGTWLARRTTRPVQSLVDLTRAYARREFTARSTVRTGDELEMLGSSLSDMADQLSASEGEITRRAGVEANLSRFLPDAVARSIADGTRSLALGGERRAISVLFADVVSFTSFAEHSPPERVVALLNELFTVLTEVVFRHGGIVDKFMGDCVMAVFGAPNDQPDHCARAVAAAEDMHRFVTASAESWKETYGVAVQLGIGISTGDALVGNLGSEARMEYTAIGDVVNVGARLESLARPGQTLVTAEAARSAGSAFDFGSLGRHDIRGKREPVEILELR